MTTIRSHRPNNDSNLRGLATLEKARLQFHSAIRKRRSETLQPPIFEFAISLNTADAAVVSKTSTTSATTSAIPAAIMVPQSP